MKKKLLPLILSLMIFVPKATAQEWMRLHHKYKGVDWCIPLEIGKYSQWDFSSDKARMNAYALLEDSTELVVPFSINEIDSIDFANALTDDEKGHNKYRPFTMHITTEDYANIVEKEVWLNCHISIDGKGEYSDYSGTGRIRGRGNSTWEWYDKKPYKFKLDKKSKLLGLEKAKNWNLLANWRDVTDLMNVYAFEAARYMGMSNTNHSRFVEVFLNNEYVGTYQLTEKIEVGKNRIEIDEEEGLLLSFDLDDGPSLSPNETNNFWSKIYSLPICVKYPEDPDEQTLQDIKNEFATLESAISGHNYEKVSELLDIPSFISILQLHELLDNVEIEAPRSIYFYRDKGGKFVMGPVWDWDAGFDFSWSDMYTGHNFFGNYTGLMFGTDPYKNTGAFKNVSKFWRNMFGDSQFVKEYKEAWAAISDSIYDGCWEETYKYAQEMFDEGAYDRDIAKWPLKDTSSSGGWWGSSDTYFSPKTEIEKMSKWIKNRKNYLDGIIANYPDGTEGGGDVIDPSSIKEPEVTYNDDKSISVKVTALAASGYTQSYQINIDESKVVNLLGGNPKSLVPIDADGYAGSNTAAGTYGAWFSSDGYTTSWGNDSHIYIESDNLYTWKYGCHPSICRKGDTHTVTMRYKRSSKYVNVNITFEIK